MAPVPEEVYKEFEGLFDHLKRASQKPTVMKLESGDKTYLQNNLDQLFVDFQKRLDEVLATLEDGDGEERIKILAMKASLDYEDAKIKLTLEDYIGSREILERAVNTINGLESNPFIVYLHLRIINHLSFTLSKMCEYEAAKILLKEITAKELPTDIAIYSTEELFTMSGIRNTDAKAKLHSIYINNLQMLSWVYSKMGLEYESAMMQHKILEQELEYEDCDPVDWAMRCTRVASLYLVKLQFMPARYYLSAASSALDRVEASLMEHPDLGKAQAELARGWIYYGLRLFDTSKSRDIHKLCSKIFDESAASTSNVEESTQEAGSNSAKKVTEGDETLDESFKFPNSEVKIANVPVKFVSNVAEARLLFHHTQMWLKRARVYYTLRDYPFIYVNCVLDLSELYRFLAFYEPDLDTQYNVQRRRADALETLSTILKEVRPQCYIAVSVELLRELAEVQVELMGINLKKMYKIQDPAENEESLKHRMDSVYNIQTKLEKIGNVFTSPASEHALNKTAPAPSPSQNNVAKSSSVSSIETKVAEVNDNQVNSL